MADLADYLRDKLAEADRPVGDEPWVPSDLWERGVVSGVAFLPLPGQPRTKRRGQTTPPPPDFED
jgi:hypothetical protein